MNTEIIRLPEVLKRTGVSRSTWLLGCKAGRFPRPIRLTDRAVGWLSSDIESFVAERVAARDAESSK